MMAAIPPSSRPSKPTKLAITPISAASSPASIASPASAAPSLTSAHQLAMKPASSAGSPQPLPLATMASAAVAEAQVAKGSITSREWVIPPRPKPGRKPATDTPPTKRKAQNRAAQRAFRERRAARVGELEEQIDEQREEYERVEQELRDQVQGLDAEVQSLRSHCEQLEELLQKERNSKSRMSADLDNLRRQWREERSSSSSRNGSLPQLARLHSASSIHQTPRSSIASISSEHQNSASFSISQIISPPDPSTSSANRSGADAGCGSCDADGPCACVEDVLASAGTPIDCGKCSIGTKCPCLEAALNPNSASMSMEPDLKRRPSSLSGAAPEEKRQKANPPSHDEYEIDFTAAFSRKSRQAATVDSVPISAAPDPQPLPQATVFIPPRDSCGFCKEGTYCMCAEAAAAAAASSQLPPMGHQVQTPPPSENDVSPLEFTATGAVRLPSLSSLTGTRKQPARIVGGCGVNGPGTCAQCLSDPKSGLFCRSLAANFDRRSGGTSNPAGGCCGGSAGGGGCCKSRGATPSSSTTPMPTQSQMLGVSLSCADTYKTLSSHRNFEKAADEIGTWLPKLRAVEVDEEFAGQGGGRARLPIEVETASIMSVLKGFDVRFGREG